MKPFATLAATALFALIGATAASALERVRGTIDRADGSTLTVKSESGAVETIDVSSAKVVSVVPSNLDAIKDGVFIGTATKGESPMTALEVVLFPEAMRGTGEGHYAWDAITDHTAGGSKVKSAMTNGTVKAETSDAPKVKSAMTNGTVQAGKAAAEGGSRTLTVSYGKDGGTKTIVVPPSAPIVAFEQADKSVLAPGGKVFAVVAKDGGKTDAKLVAVGKDGLTPPM
ncbi:metal ABC transporter permease [Methylorubrum thiocyanatum]|uniref:metal ABC transporter permease n=1 Tax=Methylorubrum thiocyanatum TaxID=47958 RepID=UPI00398C59EE